MAKFGKIAILALACSVSFTSVARANGDAFIGGLIGAGAAILLDKALDNASKKHRNVSKTRSPRTVPSSRTRAERQENAEIQRRLNLVGFYAGEPDGILGPKSRNAIKAFQASLGKPQSGRLAPFEIALLYQYSDRAILAKQMEQGGMQTMPSLSSPDGKLIVSAPSTAAPSVSKTEKTGQFSTVEVVNPETGVPQSRPAVETDEIEIAKLDPARQNSIEKNMKPDAPARDTLASEVSFTSYKTPGTQPRILDVTLGEKASAAFDKFKTAGFDECAHEEQVLGCSRVTDALQDHVVAWANREQDKIFTLIRTIKFTEPRPRAEITQQFSSAFPALMAASGNAISSSPACDLTADIKYQIREMASYAQMIENRGALPDSQQEMVKLAHDCPLGYMIDFQGDDMISEVTLTFFEATIINRAVAVAEQDASPTDFKL